MTHASLFSGIGGPEVAAAMMGWKNAFHCEINPFGRTILEYWFPNSVSYEDITKTDFREWRGKIDVLTGGFPCQPFSYAGKRGGESDDRYLWPEMLRAIDEIRPTWVVGENVAGIATMVEGGVLSQMGRGATLFGEENDYYEFELREDFTIERICRDFENIGYTVQPMLIPAAAVGAPHQRDRVFIIAYTDRRDDEGIAGKNEGESQKERIQEWDKIREFGIASGFRSEIKTFAEDSVSIRRGGGTNEIKRRVGNVGVAGTGDDERLHSKQGDNAANSDRRDGERKCQVEREITRRNGIDGDGRERDAADPHVSRRKSQVKGGKAAGGRRVDEIKSERGCASERANGLSSIPRISADTIREGLEGKNESRREERGERMRVRGNSPGYIVSAGADLLPENRWEYDEFGNYIPPVPPVHRGYDGIPIRLDDLSISFAEWRRESLKAYGNAIVPQVMYRIFQAIEFVSSEK